MFDEGEFETILFVILKMANHVSFWKFIGFLTQMEILPLKDIDMLYILADELYWNYTELYWKFDCTDQDWLIKILVNGRRWLSYIETFLNC